MVQGGMSCIKYILAIFSFVFVVFGVLLIVFGSISLSSANSFEEVIDSPDNTAIFSIIIGVVVFAISFLGCCGSLRENHCMLTTFASFLVVIVIIEFIIAGLVIAFKNAVPQLAEKSIKSKLCDYNATDENAGWTKFFDEMQKKFECCGSVNASDWFTCPNMHNTLPTSCCKEVNGTKAECTLENAFTRGCGAVASDLLRQSFGVLGGVVLSIALLQLLGIVFSCCLGYAVKREYQVV